MLIAENIEKSYGSQKILRKISLKINDGEFVSIMGESGSGKSTLLSILSGNMRADAGSVILDGVNITDMTESDLALLRRTKLGFVYQSLNLVPTLSSEDNILLPIYLSKKKKKDYKKKLSELTKRLGISHLMKKLPEDMSGGERQRVAIARAMIHDPKILMLDEPTGSLDSKSTDEVLKLLKGLKNDLGVTIIQVTHSRDAAAFSDRIINIIDGQVAE